MQVILFTDVADTSGYGKYAGTYKVATEIRNAGYTCQIVDLFSKFSYEQLEKILDKFVTSETILIGFSCTLMEKRVGLYGSKSAKVYNFGRPNEEVASLMQFAKRKNLKLKTVAGGARINSVSNWPFIDYTVINKGDVAIIKLIEHLKFGSNLPGTKVVGHSIMIDGSSQDYFYTQEQFAGSKILYQPQDIILPGEVLPIEVSRGCIFSCSYCHFDLIGKRIGDWQKTVDSLKEELIRNYELYGTTEYMVSDELINESMPKMNLVHEAFTTLPFDIKYTSYARLDLIHAFPEQRDMIQESGAVSITFGIETMSEIAGKKAGKGLGPKRVKETLNYCSDTWKSKIVTSSNFIVGLPGETEESLRSTVDWLVSNDCPLDIFGFTTLFVRSKTDGRAESKIDKDPKKFNMIIHEDKTWESENMTFARASELTAKFFKDPRVQEKVKFGAATWIGRILNLDYTIEEIYIMIKDGSLSKTALEKNLAVKSNALKELYYKELMKI
jgi:hypothetical protein